MHYDKSIFSEENIKILENFKTCVNERSLEKMTKPLYEFLHIFGPFIAHYSHIGFKTTYEGIAFLNFIKEYEQHIWPIRIDTDEYRQVNAMNEIMQQYVQAHKEEIIFEFNNNLKSSEIMLLKALAEKLGYELTPKESATGVIDLNTKIEANGQVSLF